MKDFKLYSSFSILLNLKLKFFLVKQVNSVMSERSDPNPESREKSTKDFELKVNITSGGTPPTSAEVEVGTDHTNGMAIIVGITIVTLVFVILKYK